MDMERLVEARDSLRFEIATAEGSAREQRDDLDRLEQWILEVESMKLMSVQPPRAPVPTTRPV
jgi:hypothetical protein